MSFMYGTYKVEAQISTVNDDPNDGCGDDADEEGPFLQGAYDDDDVCMDMGLDAAEPVKVAPPSDVRTQEKVDEEKRSCNDYVCLPPVPGEVRVVTLDMQRAVVESLGPITDDDVRRICAYPQRTPEWFDARKHRITGSVCGAAIGNSPYQKPRDLVFQLMWSTFKGNKFTDYGTKNEPLAQQAYINIMRKKHGPGFNLGLPGLIVSRVSPYLAYSADGVAIFTDGNRRLIEIKCPYKRQRYNGIPPMYFCQMQLGMHILRMESCDFIEYCGSEEATFITPVPRDPEFIRRRLLPGLRHFFFEMYLPMAVAKSMGWLGFESAFMPYGTTVERYLPLPPIDTVPGASLTDDDEHFGF